MSGDRWASLASAIMFVLAMVVSLKFSPNKTMVCLNLGFIVLTVVFILIDQLVFSPFLQFLTLFYGVFIGSFSIFDIYDDLITRTVEGSDAHGEITSLFLKYIRSYDDSYLTSFCLSARCRLHPDIACHKMVPCCLPRCVGVQFAVVALAFQALGLYLALVWMSSDILS